MTTREDFEAALGEAGYYDSTWVGDKGDLERFHALAIAAHEREKAGAQALREAAEKASEVLHWIASQPASGAVQCKAVTASAELDATLRGQGGCAVCGSDKCVAGECNDSMPIGINGLTEAETAASASVMGLTKNGTNQ